MASFLNTTLRAVKLYWVQFDGHWPCQFPYWGLWCHIHIYLVMLGFWVRQCKIHQILIRLLGRLLWSYDPFKMGIFWILAKFWIRRVIFGKNYVMKKLRKWCYKNVNYSHKHPVLLKIENQENWKICFNYCPKKMYTPLGPQKPPDLGIESETVKYWCLRCFTP